MVILLGAYGLRRWLRRRSESATPDHPVKMRLHLATYNIHSCVGGDGRYDPNRIVWVLKELNADVIALQEVDAREHRGLELLDHLAEETGLQAVPGPTLLRHTGHYGNALLSRLHIRDVRRLDLSFLNHEPRGAIDAGLEWHSLMLQVAVPIWA
jgi:endonuclease/exonuclease/phosphatase family metal-dependent hydrolase